MTIRQPRYSMDEFTQRGQDIYERLIRPQVEANNKGKIVAIDIETSEYEIGQDTLTASDRLYQRLPDAQIWCVRVGHRAVHRIGRWDRAEAQ